MDLTLSDSQRAFRDELRGWLAEHVPPPYTGYAHSSDLGYVEYLRDWQRELHRAGYAGITWPSAYGGRGATAVEQNLFVEEMARAQAPDLIGAVGLSLIGPTIIAYGSEEQKRAYLAPMLAGDTIWCQGFSEPNSGSDLASLSMRAVRDGDTFVVDGQKVWTSFAHVSDYCFLLVRTDTEVRKHRGITCLLVDMRSPGIEVRPLRMMSGDAIFNELFFSNVRVPASQVLGELNGGWQVAITALMNERANLGAGVRISMARSLEALIDAAHQVPRGDASAADDPAVRQQLAQAHLELEVFRMTSARSLSRIARDGVPGPEGSILKLFWSELNQRTARAAMEIVGPYGLLTDESSVFGRIGYGYLRCRGNTIEAGTSEVLRNIVAERVLGLPKSY